MSKGLSSQRLSVVWSVFLVTLLIIVVMVMMVGSGNWTVQLILGSPPLIGSVCPWNKQHHNSNVASPHRVYDDAITLWQLPRNYLPYTPKGVSQLLPEYRNPCWYGPIESEPLFCLPYFYLIGVAKCGSTELYNALVMHPDIESPIKKELFFWGTPSKRKTFPKYLSNFREATRKILMSFTASGCHNKITFEATPAYFSNHGSLDQIPGNSRRKTREPLYTMAHTLYAVNPGTKLVVTLRHPTNRLFSHYHHFCKDAFGPGDFHQHVETGIRMMKTCLSTHSLRSCAFDFKLNNAIRQDNRIMLHYSMYYIYAKEWLSVFPRDQVLFIKAEEFYANSTKVLSETFQFLNIGEVPQSLYHELSAKLNAKYKDPKNKKAAYRDKMWNKTRVLLDDFFKPFNQDLARLLGDDKWLFGA